MQTTESAARPAEPSADKQTTRINWLQAALPLAILGLLVWAFLTIGPLGILPTNLPPVEEVTIERIVLTDNPKQFSVYLVNSGPDPVTIAQVLVDDAYWDYQIAPDQTIPRLGQAVVTVPYPWVEGEPHVVKFLTSTGLTFEGEVPVAVATPQPDLLTFGVFALMGLYVGVIPVALGLLWFPVMRRLGRRGMDFILALTVGLLIFLGLDAVKEALDLAGRAPEPFHGFSVVGIGLLGALLALITVSRRTVAEQSGRSEAQRRLAVAYLIALGIGLHNLGEGLAIGASYAIGEVALGALLVVGFTIHNTTEGPAIVAPIARDGATLRHLALLGLLGGGPTILGAWLGGFAYSPIWAALFLAIGAGAIFQVVFQLARLPGRGGPGWLAAPVSFAGLLVGMALMYATGLLVAT